MRRTGGARETNPERVPARTSILPPSMTDDVRELHMGMPCARLSVRVVDGSA
jgi:hypothetical protein